MRAHNHSAATRLPVLYIALTSLTSSSSRSSIVKKVLLTALVQSIISKMSFYDIVEKDYQGAEIPFSRFRGKVCLGTNVASRCGYTLSGYSLVSKLSKVEGVTVLLFPCNQFGGQEPGTDSEIYSFCIGKGGTLFLQF